MKKHKHKVKYLPGSRTDEARARLKVLPNRVCIGARHDRDCNTPFKPKNEWNFLCQLCNEYAQKHSED